MCGGYKRIPKPEVETVGDRTVPIGWEREGVRHGRTSTGTWVVPEKRRINWAGKERVQEMCSGFEKLRNVSYFAKEQSQALSGGGEKVGPKKRSA